MYEVFKDILIPVLVAISVWYMSKLSSDRNAASFICEKRQDWIDELRKEVSEYMSICLYWAYEKKFPKEEKAAEIEEKCHKDSFSLFAIIRLRLNLEDDEYSRLLNELTKLRLVVIDTKANDLKIENGIVMEKINDIFLLCEEILKCEWERVKKETAFPKLFIDNLKRAYPSLRLNVRLYKMFRRVLYKILVN